ncbi:unnamed protein product [Fraxinus pennsylvanica]|uniref:MADS-box domain-containing protein n=1 Tax=Fraxinus pennsylvanica TaxID=56036 RepID=A0AAD2DR24_9LAMI|nr:unnamed protein product [Fraxinus pennsylvanica]
MARKKVKRVKIAQESTRNNILKNRTEGLVKKASQLSILSGSDIGIVIHKPGQNNTTLWPSPDDFRARLNTFSEFSEMEREKKMVMHDKYLVKKVEEETEKLRNIQIRNDHREYETLMNGLIEGKSIDELDLNQINVFCSIAAEKLKELQTWEELNEKDGPISSLLAPPLPPVAIDQAIQAQVTGEIAETAHPTLIENLKTDAWFIETMFDNQINRDSPESQ